MTLTSTTNRVQYDGNGATVGFAIPFKFSQNNAIKAILRSDGGSDATQTFGSDFTVTGAGESGGTATWTTAPDSSQTVILYRDESLTQTLDLADKGDFDAESIERAFDKIVAMVQRLDERVNRSFRLLDGDSTDASITVPLVAARASKFLAFDASGNAIPSSGTAGVSVPVSTFAETILDDTNGSTALVTLGVSPFNTTMLDETNASNTLVALGVSPFNVTVLDETNASNTLVALGVTPFAVTMLNDASAAEVRATLALDQTSRIVSNALAGTAANSVGSGSNRVFRFSADLSQTGADWTMTTDSTLGSVFTNLLGGLFAFELTTFDGTATRSFGFSLDATGGDLTTPFYDLTADKRIGGVSSAIGLRTSTTSVRRIAANQVVRAHVQEAAGVNQSVAFLQITKIGN